MLLFMMPAAIVAATVVMLEPKSPQECVAVRVIGTWHIQGRGGGYGYTVTTLGHAGSPQVWHPGLYNTPFDPQFRGVAILLVRHALWTGDDIVRLSNRCPVPPGSPAAVVMSRDVHHPAGYIDNRGGGDLILGIIVFLSGLAVSYSWRYLVLKSNRRRDRKE